MLANSNFTILGILHENKESNSHNLIEKPEVLPQNWEKNENSLILECFFANFNV